MFQNISIAAWDPGKFNSSLEDWLVYFSNVFLSHTSMTVTFLTGFPLPISICLKITNRLWNVIRCPTFIWLTLDRSGDFGHFSKDIRTLISDGIPRHQVSLVRQHT